MTQKKYKFKDIFLDDSKNVSKINLEGISNKGTIAVVDQSKTHIAGYVEEKDFNVCKDERIIFGDHTRIIKYINKPFIAGADGVKVLKLKDELNCLYKFYYYYLQYMDIPNNGYSRHFKYLKEFEFAIPSIEYQKNVAEKIEKIEELINIKEKQKQELDKLIKSQYINLFGNPYTNDKNWDVFEWNKVLTIKNGRNQKKVEDKNGKFPIYGSGGLMSYANDYICNEDTVIIGRKGNINNPILVRSKFWNVDTAFGLEPNKDKMLVEYLYYFCDFYNFEQHNRTVTIPSLTKVDLLKILIPIPPMELQIKFKEFVKYVEIQKEVCEKILSKLNELKQSKMQEFFGGFVDE